MLFNVKEFNRFYHEGVELSRIVKIILLRLLQVQTFTNGLYIKWTLPNSVFLFLYFYYKLYLYILSLIFPKLDKRK